MIHHISILSCFAEREKGEFNLIYLSTLIFVYIQEMLNAITKWAI